MPLCLYWLNVAAYVSQVGKWYNINHLNHKDLWIVSLQCMYVITAQYYFSFSFLLVNFWENHSNNIHSF